MDSGKNRIKYLAFEETRESFFIVLFLESCGMNLLEPTMILLTPFILCDLIHSADCDSHFLSRDICFFSLSSSSSSFDCLW